MPDSPPDSPPPLLDRPTFHVWYGEGPDDDSPTYLGTVAVTNADQLTAETQAKAVGITDPKASLTRLTNLWVWAACVRRGLVSDKFGPFTQRVELQPVPKAKAAAASVEAGGPTGGGEDHSTPSASSSPPSSGEAPSIGDAAPTPTTH